MEQHESIFIKFEKQAEPNCLRIRVARRNTTRPVKFERQTNNTILLVYIHLKYCIGHIHIKKLFSLFL